MSLERLLQTNLINHGRRHRGRAISNARYNTLMHSHGGSISHQGNGNGDWGSSSNFGGSGGSSFTPDDDGSSSMTSDSDQTEAMSRMSTNLSISGFSNGAGSIGTRLSTGTKKTILNLNYR
ncbi:unnamed protein product [Ambrosiozyma monospora]|uniref:Unnamed protein product n=1 Tax=Ambrosiozyma monospora TaxID=43982 RepID=A0ACB5U4P5_AMBMO|nr:unnamed protein product [Ambrosiozyma monospora]